MLSVLSRVITWTQMLSCLPKFIMIKPDRLCVTDVNSLFVPNTCGVPIVASLPKICYLYAVLRSQGTGLKLQRTFPFALWKDSAREADNDVNPRITILPSPYQQGRVLPAHGVPGAFTIGGAGDCGNAEVQGKGR